MYFSNMELNSIKRFGTGFIASLVVPIAKLYQNGMIITNISFLSILGASIPIVAMSLLVGLYALFIKYKETDIKKLFEICILLPGIFVALVSTKNLDTNKLSFFQESNALYDKKKKKEIKCSKQSEFIQGIHSTWNIFRNRADINYYLVSKTPQNKN